MSETIESLFPTLRAVAETLNKADITWAIGGSIAMRPHGYVRETKDIDISIVPDEQDEALDALASQGIVTFPEHEDFQWSHRKTPSSLHTIDFMFPHGNPDIGALVSPKQYELDGMTLNFWAPEYVAAGKCVAGRVQDAADVSAMIRLGCFKLGETRDILEREQDIEAVDFLRKCLARSRDRNDHKPTRGRR